MIYSRIYNLENLVYRRSKYLMKRKNFSMNIFIVTAILNLLIYIIAIIMDKHLYINIPNLLLLILIIILGIIGLYNLIRMAIQGKNLSRNKVYIAAIFYIFGGLFGITIFLLVHLTMSINYFLIPILGLTMISSGILLFITEFRNRKEKI